MTVSYTILLVVILAIFLFCYFVATRIWIKVDEQNKDIEDNQELKPSEKANRRDFLYISSITVGGLGAASFIWPFLKSMNPAQDTLALGSTEVDISNIEVGQSVTVKWRGKPVFIRRRTISEIQEAREVNIESLRDPAKDSERVKQDEWLVLVLSLIHI